MSLGQDKTSDYIGSSCLINLQGLEIFQYKNKISCEEFRNVTTFQIILSFFDCLSFIVTESRIPFISHNVFLMTAYLSENIPH